ncbi:hypothetical protein GpartN1_g1476.t1 [Galdieria partita]|uniref:Uncharacterized protein n=1 Tax=Galdieria partita TaxID=83374 RepID=A0A9C7UNM8_9RHOD|nr:hypothetical protein GpartN1_g1476.t1 [Galdieria partita]
MTLSDETKFLEWIDNLCSYLNNSSYESLVSQSLILVTNQWIEYFAKQHTENISVATLSRLSQITAQLIDRCKRVSSGLHNADWILLRKVLAIWRNGCRNVDFRTFLMDSGFVDTLVSDLETLLEGEGSILIAVVLQLLANVTNDKCRPLCLWRNDTITPPNFYHLLLRTAKKEYDRNPLESKLLLAFEMLWNNQFCYLMTSESLTWLLNDNQFWTTFLGWIEQHLCASTEHHCDVLYWLFIMMEKMAENSILCNWLFCSNRRVNCEESHVNTDECKVTLKDSSLFHFVGILRDALMVGEQAIVLSRSDICSFCANFQQLCFQPIVDDCHVAWLELVALILADHFSTSPPIYEETKEYLVSVVDCCCHVLRLLQENSSWMGAGDKVGLKTTLTRLLCNICSISKEMITHIVYNQQYLVTLLKQWQLDTEAPLSFEWTVFLFRLFCEQQEAAPVIKQTLQAFQEFSSQQSDVS